MNAKTLISAAAITAFATASFAQDTVVTPEAGSEVAVELPAGGTVLVEPVPATGFVPVAGAALGAAGPLAIGLGAIIAIGALSGGGGSSSSTNGTN